MEHFLEQFVISLKYTGSKVVSPIIHWCMWETKTWMLNCEPRSTLAICLVTGFAAATPNHTNQLWSSTGRNQILRIKFTGSRVTTATLEIFPFLSEASQYSIAFITTQHTQSSIALRRHQILRTKVKRNPILRVKFKHWGSWAGCQDHGRDLVVRYQLLASSEAQIVKPNLQHMRGFQTGLKIHRAHWSFQPGISDLAESYCKK